MSQTRPLTDLLGETRAEIVRLLQRSPGTAGHLAEMIGITPAAVRRHLGVLAKDDLICARSVHDGSMGRPHDEWTLTARGKRLFADHSSAFAGELIDHLQQSFGRGAVLDFLRERSHRQADRYESELADSHDPVERATRLAEALSDDGFAAEVTDGENGRSLTLLQTHCAIEGIAKDHPEVCAHEAALFKRLLGTSVSRRTTIASGADACVCHIDLPTASPATTESSTSNRSN